MGTVFGEIIMAIFLSWMPWALSYVDSGQEVPQVQERQVQTEAGQEESRSRGVFSAYVVGGLDCMDDGSYDEYVEYVVNIPTDAAEPEAQVRSEEFPMIYFKFMGLDLTDYISVKNPQRAYFHKAFCSDGFYMEYPGEWYVGSTDACPLTFVPEWEYDASRQYIQEWVDYFDENLAGDIGEVQAYIEGGGIRSCLEEVVGKPVTDDYELVLREKDSDWLLIYDLEKEGKQAAEIVVWCNLGKLSARNWEMELTVAPEEDYGRIMVFREWDDFDFSSEENIKWYVESADFLYRLLGKALEEDVEDEIISLDPGSFTSLYHEFVQVDLGVYDKDHTERLLRQAAAYIPITRPDQPNWVVLFEWFPGSRQEEGVGNPQVRERVMSTFAVLPYYHRVKKGENLSVIAKTYGEDPELAYEIASYKPNGLRQPDLIRSGQEIQIPLRVLFRKIHH